MSKPLGRRGLVLRYCLHLTGGLYHPVKSLSMSKACAALVLRSLEEALSMEGKKIFVSSKSFCRRLLTGYHVCRGQSKKGPKACAKGPFRIQKTDGVRDYLPRGFRVEVGYRPQRVRAYARSSDFQSTRFPNPLFNMHVFRMCHPYNQ